MFMYAAMGMSMAAQIDMRAELRQANIVKGMPIVAWKIVMAQVASSVASMTLAMWGLGACLWLFAPVVRGPIFCACALGLPFLAFAVAPAAMIPAILYPEMRDMLQNYLSGMLAVLFVGMAVAPPAAVGATYFFLLRRDLCSAIILACAASAVMGAAGVCVASRAFRAFDPSGE